MFFVKQIMTFNDIQPWTMNYNNPKSAMSLLGLGPRGSENITLFDFSLGNDLGNAHFAGALELKANHCIYLHSPTLTNYNSLVLQAVDLVLHAILSMMVMEAF